VLEFNCRLGDPETQALVPRLDEDLLELLASATEGRLPDRPLRWHDMAAVDVVLASAGYPETPDTGRAITGMDTVAAMSDVQVFHAGTFRTRDGLITSGGRVLNVVGLGPDVAAARRRAYDAAGHIHFGGMHHRTDIGS
jgi:phosphoribosylamine--glycine ligase